MREGVNTSELPIADLRDPDATGIIALDFPCVKCGYNLRGLSTDLRCPECGVPIRDALQANYIFTWPPEYFPTPKNKIILGIYKYINASLSILPIAFFLIFMFKLSGGIFLPDNIVKILSISFDFTFISIFLLLNIDCVQSFRKIIRVKKLFPISYYLSIRFYSYISISIILGFIITLNNTINNVLAYSFIAISWAYLLLMHNTIKMLIITIPYHNPRKGLQSIYSDFFYITIMYILFCFFGKLTSTKYIMGILIIMVILNNVLRTCAWYCSYGCHWFHYFMEMTLLDRQDELEKYDSSWYLWPASEKI